MLRPGPFYQGVQIQAAHLRIADNFFGLVPGIQPLSAGAELKCRDRVLGKGGKKNSFIVLPGKGGPHQANALKPVTSPPQELQGVL